MAMSQVVSEPVRWNAFPSWKQFSWLFLFGIIAGLRAFMLVWSGEAGWAVWAAGSATLFLIIAALRNWAHYVVTSSRVIVRNGYTGKDIETLRIDELGDLSIEQGPVGRVFDIGTIVLRDRSGAQTLLLRGVTEPNVIRTRIDALRK
ncbi:MAG TPA: PH domain-containing protein [Nitrospiraceae bacterium]|nr:PH domain-containing protein [Nitrospiraceae bacterium]